MTTTAGSTTATTTPDLDAGLSALGAGSPTALGAMPEGGARPGDELVKALSGVKEEEPETEVEPKDEAPPEKAGEEERPRARTAEEKSALERARTALRRDKVPVAVLDAMDEDKLLKWGASRATAQADADDAFRQLGELRKEKETWETKVKESAPSEPAEQPLDLKTLGTTLSRTLADEEAANAVVGHFESLEKRSTARTTALEAKLAESSSTTQRLVEMVLNLEKREARRGLEERFPQLRDERDFAKVWDKMQKLAPSGEYESMQDLMAEASVLLFHEADSRRTTDNSQQLSRRNGLPTTNSRATPPKVLSDREKAMAKLIELEKKHGFE